MRDDDRGKLCACSIPSQVEKMQQPSKCCSIVTIQVVRKLSCLRAHSEQKQTKTQNNLEELEPSPRRWRKAPPVWNFS